MSKKKKNIKTKNISEISRTPNHKVFYAIIGLFAFLLYANTIPNNYSLDDNLVVYQHPQIMKGIKAIPEIFSSHYREVKDNTYGYRPIAKSTFAIEHDLFGQNPHISHLINILLYVLLALMLFKLLLKLFKERSAVLLLFTVLLFVAHPLHTEVVASLKNREELLCFIFGLASVFCFIVVFSDRKKMILFSVIGVILLVLSVFSKQTGLVFSAIIPLILLQFYTKKSDFSSLKENKKSIALLVIVTLSVFIAGYLAYKLPEIILPDQDKPVFVFENPLFTQNSFIDKIVLSLLTGLQYLKLLIVPYPLRFYYGYNMVPLVEWYNMQIIISAAIYIGLIWLAVWNFYKNKFLSFGILFFLAGLLMFLNLILPIPGIIGERLVFVASFGFCIFFAYIIYKVTAAKNEKKTCNNMSKTFYITMIGLIAAFSVITFTRNFNWKNRISLYESDIRHLQNSAKANAMYADELMLITYKATETTKNFTRYKDTIALALDCYKRSVEIYPENPAVNNNIGTIYFNFYKKYDLAMHYFKAAYIGDTGNTESIYNIAMACEARKKDDSARVFYTKYCLLKPADLDLLSKTANLNFMADSLDIAILLNNKIKSLYPESDLPYINLGNYYLQKGETTSAVSQWEKAIQVYPDNYSLCMNLYMYYKSIKNSQKADFYLQKAKIATQTQ